MQFLVQTGEARVLTGDLNSIIRQQRHTGTRVIIATQEPTLSPELIELCNVTLVHRFLSPRWYEVLKRHLAAARDQGSHTPGSLLETIVTLRTGEALLFCPTAQLDLPASGEDWMGWMGLRPLGNRYAKVQIRKRTTIDGGRSITAMESGIHTESDTDVDIPMYIVPQVTKKKTNATRVAANVKGKIVPSKTQIKKSIGHIAAGKQALGWGLLKDLTPLQKSQLYSDAEAHLNAKAGVLSGTAELKALFDKQYDAITVSCNRDQTDLRVIMG